MLKGEEEGTVNEIFRPTEFTIETNGYVEHIVINENREVFVNGRNITTVTPIQSSDFDIVPFSEEWIKAGTSEYHYDLGGLTVAATAFVIDGVYIRDVRTTWYRNIDRPGRPEMKETHDVSVVAFGATIITF